MEERLEMPERDRRRGSRLEELYQVPRKGHSSTMATLRRTPEVDERCADESE